MTKAKENELRIESEIGRNVADYIFNKANKEAHNAFVCPKCRKQHDTDFDYIPMETLQEICNQPPPIEKEMTAVDVIEILNQLRSDYITAQDFTSEHAIAYAVHHIESLIKQNSEGKE